MQLNITDGRWRELSSFYCGGCVLRGLRPLGAVSLQRHCTLLCPCNTTGWAERRQRGANLADCSYFSKQ